MQDGDVLGPALKGWIFRRLEPFEREFVVVDLFDCGEPEALKYSFLVPVGGQDPRADAKSSRAGALSSLSIGGTAEVA